MDLEPLGGPPRDVMAMLQRGAVLENVRGERFMRRFAPDLLERAPAALVVAAAEAEIRARRCTSRGAVFVDATHLARSGRAEALRFEVVPIARTRLAQVTPSDDHCGDVEH